MDKYGVYSLLILIMSTVVLGMRVKNLMDMRIARMRGNYKRVKNDCERLLQENTRLKSENSVLGKAADDIIALYDITKEICKHLDTAKVFESFREQLGRYIEVVDCRFLESGADLSNFSGHTVFPVKIEDKIAGYLAANIIREDDKDKFHILAQQFILGMGRALLYRRVQEMAVTDNLTQAFSRRYFLERFAEELDRSSKFKYDLSFVMVDIDHFKEYNDRYGHLVGDAVLKEVSKTIRENIRQIDLVGRFGGEEFTIVLAETDKKEAWFAAERIRKAIEDKRVRVYDEELRVTISAGISAFPGDGHDPQVLIDRADEAMYVAKQSGRNKVIARGSE